MTVMANTTSRGFLGWTVLVYSSQACRQKTTAVTIQRAFIMTIRFLLIATAAPF